MNGQTVLLTPVRRTSGQKSGKLAMRSSDGESAYAVRQGPFDNWLWERLCSPTITRLKYQHVTIRDADFSGRMSAQHSLPPDEFAIQ